MKKYIRTKDKVCKITEWQCDLSGEMFLVKADNKFGNDKVFVEDVIAEADTIEELCDEFVMCWLPLEKMKINERWIPTQYERLGSWQKMRNIIIKEVIKTESVLYGAIWTSKGLIYVAKMNDKGELELL